MEEKNAGLKKRNCVQSKISKKKREEGEEKKLVTPKPTREGRRAKILTTLRIKKWNSHVTRLKEHQKKVEQKENRNPRVNQERKHKAVYNGKSTGHRPSSDKRC